MVAKSLRHKFVSAVADSTDTTLVRSQTCWNDDHNFWLGNRASSSTSDTLADTDHFATINYNSSSPVAVTLPAPTGSTFLVGWTVHLINQGSGAVTITPGGSATINAKASLVLAPGMAVAIFSDGTNYSAIISSPGVVVGSAYAELTTNTSTTALMAGAADTIPQQTDGVQLLTASITPKSSVNKLLVSFSTVASISSNNAYWFALFQDATAAALAATSVAPPGADYMQTVVMNVEFVSGTASSTTLKVRFGGYVGGTGTIAVNGLSSSRRLGGAMRSALLIQEML